MSQPQVMGRRSGRHIISGSGSDNKKRGRTICEFASIPQVALLLCRGDGDGRTDRRIAHTSPDHIYNNMNLSVGAEIVNE